MPKATTSITETETFNLKTCPEGFVVLRRMNYGEYLQRREMVSGMTIKGDANSRSAVGTIQMAQRKVMEFEFANCIMDHNLEDEGGTKLDFKNPFTFNMLDPRVGDEIGKLIDDMNQYDAEAIEGK